MTFDQAFERVIAHEGGYSNHPGDPGNWTGGKVGAGKLLGTRYGIAANSYPDEDIPNLTLERAKEIYRRDYWERVRADQLPAAVRFDVFDLCVNSGVSRAARLLQRACGAREDGVIGPATLAAAAAMPPHQLAARLAGHRLAFMADLPAWETFSRGWARRVAQNLMET